jgi:hypothetical protein
MRLTLRTLLAWMDGVLPEADRGPLGEKVFASPVARQLLERIEAAIARPQLPSPRVEGKGLASDPNSVAQYLDNTLPTDQLEPFERVCLESDTHLAEIAGCHQILAELAVDPGAMPVFDAEGRARLLAALRQVAPVPPGTAPREPVERVRGGGRLPARPEPQPSATRQPRRPTPWLAWGSAAVALLVVVALMGLLTLSLTKPRAGLPDAQKVAGPPLAAGGVFNGGLAADGGIPAPAAEGPPQPVDQNLATTSAAAAQSPSTTPATGDANEAVPPQAVVAGPRAGDGRAGPMPTPLEVAVTVAAAAEMPAGAVPGAPVDTAPAATVAVTGEWPLVWRAAGGAGEWQAGLPGSQLPLGADVVVPPGCTPEVTLADVTIRLLPRTRAVFTMDGAEVPHLELVFGRALIRSSRPDAVVAIRAAGQQGTLAGALSGGAAIEVTLERSAGDDPATVAAVTRGVLVPVATGLRWRPVAVAADGAAEEVALESRRRLGWDSRDPTAITVAEPAGLPSWAAGDGGGDRLERAAAAGFRARLEAGAPVDAVLTAMAAARRVEERSLAAATLALLGRFEPLVALLVADAAPLQVQNRQWELVEAGSVPLALARGTNAAARLRQALVALAPPGKADLLWRLMVGFTPEELAAGAGHDLVGSLDDESLVVRRYALLRLVEATHASAADHARYRPDASPDRRRTGSEWWRRALEDARSGRGRGR